MTTEPIDIVLTTWQRERITELTLDALHKNTQTPNRLIIVDNGSNTVSQSRYCSVADVYVKMGRNMGLEYAKWLGMQFVESRYFISMDNDILVYKYDDPDWLQKLVTLMDQNPDYGGITLRPQVLIGTGNIFEGKTEDIIPFQHAPGYARIMRTQWVKDVGAWSDKRPLRGHEEYWIGDKFRERGIKQGFANHVKCWHMFGDDNTDKWGYSKWMRPEEHGHNEVAGIPGNNKEEILKGVGIDING
jgi:GT2 family glycosyltransferase